MTGKARIRDAALRLFGSRGYAGTSLRSIAAQAGVSINLVSHHFGCKAQLRAAIERFIVLKFEEHLQTPVPAGSSPPEQASYARIAHAAAAIVDTNADVRSYLRRVAGESLSRVRSTALFGELFRAMDAVIAPSGLSREQPDRDTPSVQCFLLLFGPTLLEQELADFGADLFEESVARIRRAENVRLLLGAPGEPQGVIG